MFDISHMNADLVRPASFQFQTQMSMSAEFFDNPIVCYRGFTELADCHMRALGGMTTNRRIHDTSGNHGAKGQGFVLTTHHS